MKRHLSKMTTSGISRLVFSRLILPLAISGASSAAFAVDLLETWRLANTNDRQIAAAKALFEATQERATQKNVLWETQARATLAGGMAGSDISLSNAKAMGQNNVDFSTSVNAGGMARAGIELRKPIKNQALEAQSNILDLSVHMGTLQYQQAQQDLAWRTVTHYFDILTARQQLKTTQQLEAALFKAQKEINRRYQIGDASLIDAQDVKARLAVIHAQILQARQTVDSKAVAFAQLTGQTPETLRAINPRDSLTPNSEPSLLNWLQRARSASPALQMASLQAAIQHAEANRIKVSGTTPTIDIVAQSQVDRLAGVGMSGPATQHMAGYFVGVQLSAPIGAHGLAAAREREALKQETALRLNKDFLEAQLMSNITETWQNQSATSGQLAALATAHKVSQERLKSTRHAHQTGTRSTLEWLNAEQDAAQAELAWQSIRITALVLRAKLWWQAGMLGEAQLSELNHLLSENIPLL